MFTDLSVDYEVFLFLFLQLAAKAREDGQEMLNVAKSTEAEHNQRLQKIQSELAALRAKEKQIAEERLALAREKQAVASSRSSALCVSCRTPVRDIGGIGSGLGGAGAGTVGGRGEIPELTAEQQQIVRSAASGSELRSLTGLWMSWHHLIYLINLIHASNT